MGKFISNIKSKAFQMRKSPKDKRLIKNFINSVNEFKTLDETEFWEAFYEITHSDSFHFTYIRNEFISGNFFPNRYDEMCQNVELPFSYNLRYELRWWCAGFQYYAEKLNRFIKLRKDYDTCVLHEQFEDALKVLDVVQKEFGVSFWLAESWIFIYTKLDKDVDTVIDALPVSYHSFIIRFFAIKNLSTVTHAEYKKIVLHTLQSADNDELVTYVKYRLLPMDYKLDLEDFLPIMHYSEDCALVDKYLTFLDIFEFIITRDKLSTNKGMMKEFIFALKGIEDERLEAMCFCVDEPVNRLKYHLKDKLLTAKEMLIAGDMMGCRAQAAELLMEAPYCIQAIDMVAEMNIKLQDDAICCEGALLKEILKGLQIVFSLQDGWKNSAAELDKLINCCSMSNWARSLSASVLKSYYLIEEEDYIVAKRKECLQYLDIETVCECLAADEGLDYLKHTESQNKYILFRKALLENHYVNAYNLVDSEDMKCIVGICDEQKSQSEKREFLNGLKERDDTFDILASKCYLAKLDLENHFTEAMHYVTDLLINNINKAIYVPLKEYIDRIEAEAYAIRSDISVPILYYVQYKHLSSETKDDLVLMCEDFLYFQGKELPSLMNLNDGKYSRKAFVFFLRYICVPDILSTALASRITNSMDLWKERIDICQILCNIDGANEKIYEEEIKALTQKRKIYSELKIIEENRIHVNVEGIRARLFEELLGEFTRYKLYADKRWKDILENVKQKSGDPITIWNGDPERVLKEMIIKIRDAFVSSTEYGLDFALSLSIRHGAIEDALRRPLAKEGLITIYNQKEEEYEWNYKFADNISEAERESIKNAVIQLNTDTEKVINDLKKKYIQVKTEYMHEEGIFDYCITQYEFDQLSFDADYISEFSEFLDYMFEYMWRKTEINMNKMKALLRKDILDRLQAAYNTTKETIDALDRKELASLRRRVVNASNEIQNVIDKVCFWFQRSTESKNQDFDLDFVFQMGYETICNLHPETRFEKIELKPFQRNTARIDGKHLKAYSNVFSNLFDNIYKKAASKEGAKRIEYFLVHDVDRQYVYLQNDYDCTGDLNVDMQKLEQLKGWLDSEEYLEHVNGEGGTGIPKICKILRKDLRRQGNIKFGLKKEENKFYIELEI